MVGVECTVDRELGDEVREVMVVGSDQVALCRQWEGFGHLFCNKKPLEDFKQKLDMIRYILQGTFWILGEIQSKGAKKAGTRRPIKTLLL